MALVDYEAIVLDIEEHVRVKDSHGKRELLEKLADLRSEHRIKEGMPQRALRLWSTEFVEVLEQARSQPSSSSPDGVGAHGQ